MRKKVGSLLIASTILLAISPIAFAANNGNGNGNGAVSSSKVQGGPLSITPPSIQVDFPAITLNGQVQTFNSSLNNWSVTDATGTGSGWHVTVQATQLTETGVSGTPLTLPTGSLTLSGTRTITAGTGSTQIDPANGPLLANQTTAIDSTAPITIVDTQKGYGLGTYTITEPTNGLTLTLVPATTKVDTTNYSGTATPYSTTITYSVITGP